MKRTTQKAIREEIIAGRAIDATYYTCEQYDNARTTEGGFCTVATSRGAYGCNGLLAQGRKTGTIYAVCVRSSAVFLFL